MGLKSPGLSRHQFTVARGRLFIDLGHPAQLAIPGAFLAALLFAVHPLNVESVAWIAQRKGLLALVFFLLSILWYVREEQRRTVETNVGGGSARFQVGKYYWYSFAAFVLAALSKGSVVILPLVLLIIVWWRRRQLTRWDLLRSTPFWTVAVFMTLVNIWCMARLTQAPFRNASFAQRLAGAGAVVWFYLAKALAPIDLVFVYPQWRIQTVALAVVAATGGRGARHGLLVAISPSRLEPVAAIGLGILLRGASTGAWLHRRGLYAIFLGR